MSDLNGDLLKNWRERLQLSQKRLAELATISLTTLRQFELGNHKPQKKTLKHLVDVMTGIETGSLTQEMIHPPRRRKKDAVEEAPIVVAAKPVEVAPAAEPKRRGRPPKSQTEPAAPAPVAAKPAPVKPAPAPVAAKPAPVKATPAPVAPKPAPAPVEAASAPAPAPAPAPAAPVPSVIQLSNLDLELINRVLNMTGREKLALLEKLM
jgi:transcriptional regulator with XRE-family HTH domain